MSDTLTSLFRYDRNSEGQRGTATLTAVLILSLLGVFTAAAMSRVTIGQAIMNNDLGNSKSFYAAQASLEEMTRNFDNIFTFHLYPTGTDLAGVQNAAPNISGYNFTQVVTTLPAPNPPQVTIASGPYSGLQALRDSWRLDATATSWNTSEVHLTREFNNYKIPIFQFGIFYNRDLAIHPGPQMWFSGRVHSNANLFVMSGNGITFTNRVTAGGEIIRDWNRNGLPASPSNWTGPVTIDDPTGTGQVLPLQATAGGAFFGSVTPGTGFPNGGGPGTTGWLPGNPLNPDPGMARNDDANYTQWNKPTDSGLFGGNLQAHVPILQLPLQIGAGKDPIELIKRGISANDYQAQVLGQTVDDPITSLSRYCNKPGIRVSLSDSQAELPGGTGGVRLDGASDGLGGDMDADGSRGYLPQSMNDGYQATRINGFRLYGGANYVDNGSAGLGKNIPANRQAWIKVEIVNVGSNQNVTSSDITRDFLSLGMTDVAADLVNTAGNKLGDSRAILKIQRYEVPGSAVRVADLNVKDNDGSINVMTTAQAAGAPPGVTLPSFTGLSPTTANYVYSPAGSGQYLAVGPFNVFTYQTASGTVGAFNYVSMTNNNYTPSMAGDPTNAANVNGYSVLTNLHQKPDGTLNYFTNALLTNTMGNNNTWNAPLAYGTAQPLPVTASGFTWAPTYPKTYQLSNSVVPPSYQVSVVVGTTIAPPINLNLKLGGQTASLALTPTAPTAAQVQAALQALSTVGAGNCLVTGPTGAGTTAKPYVYTVYFSNPSLANNALTVTELDAKLVPQGSVINPAPYTAGSLSPASIEGQAFGTTAVINAATARNEVVVPFPIEVFNPREGIWSGNMTFDPTLATANPNWYTLYANGTADKKKNGTVPTWAGSDLPAVGVMSLIDVDVANLKSFLMKSATTTAGLTVTTPGIWDVQFPNGLTSTQVPTNPGWILYISDRRGDRNANGHYDMEDIYGPIDGTLQPGEDANLNGALDVDIPGTLTPNPFGANPNSPGTEAAPYTTGVPTDIAAFFDHQYFRRGVRLINGSQLPGGEYAGFTLATENPAYVLGNYNATGIATFPSAAGPTQYNQYIPFWDDTQNPPATIPASATTTQVPASVVADGVWILSVVWQDAGSFRWPMNAGSRTTANNPAGISMETYVRTALLTGSTQGSILAVPNQGGGTDACTDGGVHNFPRFLENWNTRLDYCGSLINPFYSRQAIGAHKTGGAVYGAPQRNWTFDADFLNIQKCPPGTPLFQFVQRTGFRETVAQEK